MTLHAFDDGDGWYGVPVQKQSLGQPGNASMSIAGNDRE
jgi:hypothetical protein